jgi:hypothetical protein
MPFSTPDCCPPPVLPPLLPPLLLMASLALFKRLDIFVVCVGGVCLFWCSGGLDEESKSYAEGGKELGYMPWSYIFEFHACVIA